MIYFLEELNTFDDTWKMTFYFVAAIAILLGLFWTLYKMYKQDNLKGNKLKENIIYNKSYDAIENLNALPQKKQKIQTQIENYYDVYQNENRRQKCENSYHDNTIEERV